MAATHCKLCGAPARFLCATANPHGPVARIEHLLCQGCGLVFVGTALRTEDLAAAYATLDQSTYYEEIRSENRGKFATARAALESLLGSPDAAVLDVGTGNGEFAEFLLSAGFARVAAHELPGADLGRLRGTPIDVYQDFDYSSIPSSAFDAVTLLDVAEHVLDPDRLFQACYRVLKPGGFVYIHTPVVSRIDRLVHRLLGIEAMGRLARVWQGGRTSIFHLQNYTARALGLVLTRAGFAEVAFAQRNELSWPVERYVRVYLCEKQGLPAWLAPAATLVCRGLLRSRVLNANKGVVHARKPRGEQTPA